MVCARKQVLTILIVVIWGLVLIGCDNPERSEGSDAQQKMRLEAVLQEHVPVLASDAFEGRAPGTAGGIKTTDYIQRQFEQAGLQPANGGSWFQEVPLVSIAQTADPQLTIAGDNFQLVLDQAESVVLFSGQPKERIELVGSELVFAGYGIVAPEYGWNDYKNLDVQGKTVVVLVNDPGFATQDPELFTGNAMTYYGGWTYKIEEAARQGAAAILMVHNEAAAGYGWQVVQGSSYKPQLTLDSVSSSQPAIAVAGWITQSAVSELFDRVGLSFDELAERAQSVGFQSMVLPLKVTTLLQQSVTRFASKNVMDDCWYRKTG